MTADRHTIVQVFGGLMNKPDLLNDTDKYCLEPSDFDMTLDRIIFSSIFNLYVNGASKIHAVDIEQYLKGNTQAEQLLEEFNGTVFLQDCEINSEVANFEYYYKNLKKINLIRDLKKNGYNVNKFYCEDLLDEKRDEINQRFETLSTENIINEIKGEIAGYENRYVLNSVVEECKASDGIRDLIIELKEKPEIGCPLQGDIFNTITRGGRKGKLYLRSAASGIGKSRSMVGDACNIAYPIRWDMKEHRWVSTGHCEKVLYVTTEQETAEIKTMILAYLTGYNEEMFLYGTFGEEHMARINVAIDIMEKFSENMLFAKVADPCSSIIKNLFRRYSLQKGVENIFYDYIFSSPAMLNEYRDLKVREDRLMSSKWLFR